MRTAESAASDQKLTAYWQMGELIRSRRLSEQSGYHNTVLRDLSEQVGVTLRTLQRAVVLHETYKSPPVADGLTWSHYRELLTLTNKTEREFYTREALKKKWTSRELIAAIAKNAFETGVDAAPAFERPTDFSYLYEAQVLAIVDADTFDLNVDLGFHTLAHQRVRLARVDSPESGTSEGRAACKFVAEQLAGAKTVVVKSLKTDTFGRFVVHMFFSQRAISIAECFLRGSHLNDLLLREKHALLVV